MAPITTILSFLLMICTAVAQMVPMNPGCSASSSSSSFPTPKITLTYTPWMAPQIGPTSTVYQAIVTTFYHIIYCSRGTATVTNVQANPAPMGPFTTKTTVSVLTVTAVDCMPSDTVITRREVRGYEDVKRSIMKKDIVAKTMTSAAHQPNNQPQNGPVLQGTSFPIPKGWNQGHVINKLKTAGQVNAKRQAVPTELSPQAAALVSQLQTAEYALELCNSDFNLTEICQQLRDPDAIIPLANVGVSASQAGDIVCFASIYGIDLNTTNAALLGDLAAAVYGLELGDNFTTTTNTTRLCNNVDLTAAPYLGIDASAVNNYICGGPSTSITVTAVTTQTVVVVPGSPTVTITASGAGFSGGFPLPSGAGTGAPNGWPNGTFPISTAGGSAVSGGAASESPWATGASSPWGNSTGTDSLGIEFPPASNGVQGGQLKTPVALDSQQYYPASTLLTTTTMAWGGYA